MKLTVLGNNGPFPGAGGACSGYLVQESGVNILLDCGNGVLGNLQKRITVDSLDAVILSHLHSDHVSDLMVLRYAVQIGMKRGMTDRLVDVYAPAEPPEEYKRLDVKYAFVLRPLIDGLTLNFGPMKLTFAEMTHPVKSFAASIEAGGKIFVYSGDTSWNENIVKFCSGADLVLLDAGLKSSDKPDDGSAAHLTARECGEIAKECGAKKLVITHFWPGYDVKGLLCEAKEVFGNVEAAEVLRTYEI